MGNGLGNLKAGIFKMGNLQKQESLKLMIFQYLWLALQWKISETKLQRSTRFARQIILSKRSRQKACSQTKIPLNVFIKQVKLLVGACTTPMFVIYIRLPFFYVRYFDLEIPKIPVLKIPALKVSSF